MKISARLVTGLTTLIIAGAVGGAIGEGAGTKIYNNLFGEGNESKVISKTGLTQAHKDGHMKSCVESGGKEIYCECTFEYIQDKISPAELKELATEFQTNQVLPDVLEEAMIACSFKSQESSSSALPTDQNTEYENAKLEIEKCKISSQNISVFDENERFAEVINEMVKNGVNLSNEQIKEMFKNNEKDFRSRIYENCLNSIP